MKLNIYGLLNTYEKDVLCWSSDRSFYLRKTASTNFIEQELINVFFFLIYGTKLWLIEVTCCMQTVEGSVFVSEPTPVWHVPTTEYNAEWNYRAEGQLMRNVTLH